ncbi:hypothetical protein GPECTOR_30g234 [Gonium pectorale]|uniref:phytol kinase n=1 Tax=Gonium pectorale TaxID=33097 RepID=A0A150GE97_GONPE|nr:hypothetical protein GPECTOR_30g234 [Gonium pectorale]|eukprot:KXZ48138.1 hypothetical protein GPECTOR_30g234 [Gonium pectorale]
MATCEKRELYDSQLLEHAVGLVLRVVLAVGAAVAGGRATPVQVAYRELLPHVAFTLKEALSQLADAHIVAAGATLGVPGTGTPGNRPDVPPPPWGPCAQYLALTDAVTTLAAAGYGGGADGKGAYGLAPELAEGLAAASLGTLPPSVARPPSTPARDELVQAFDVLLSMVEAQIDREAQPPSGTGPGTDRGGGGRGGWSFVASPRAVQHLCMRIAELAVASGQAAGGRRPRRGRRLLPASSAWHLAVRALVDARALLLLGPGLSRRRQGADGAAPPGPLLPSEYWEAVVRVLRMDAAPENVHAALLKTRGTVSRRTLHMMEIPDMGLADSLRPDAEPSASVAAAFSSGLLAGLERCVRFFSRSADPADVDMVCGTLLPALSSQPSAFQHMLAFGPRDQVAALLTTVAKLLHRCVDEAEAAAGRAALEARAAAGRAFEARRQAMVGHVDRILDFAQCNVPPDMAPCRRLMILVFNTQPLFKLLGDLRVVSLASEGPAAVKPQLRQLLPFMVQRWLPPLIRASLLAPRLPGLDAVLYGMAQDLLGFGAMALFGAADPPRLALLRASAMAGASGSADAEQPIAAEDVGAAAAAAAMAEATSPGAASAAESWRRWLRLGGGSPVPVLGMLLKDFRRLAWDHSNTKTFLGCLLAAAIAEPEALRAEVLAAAGANGDGGASSRSSTSGGIEGGGHAGSGSSGQSAAPAAAAERVPLGSSAGPDPKCRRWGRDVLSALRGMDCVARDPELEAQAACVMGLLMCLCDENAGREHFDVLASLGLTHPAARGLVHWGAALLPPDQAAAGLPPACSNPRCTNLAGDSDADLAAGPGAGLRRCGGCRVERYCCVECQRAHWRAGHGAECGGGAGAGAGRGVGGGASAGAGS